MKPFLLLATRAEGETVVVHPPDTLTDGAIRMLVLFYFYQMDRDPPTRTGLSMLPVLPTLGIEVTF